MVALPRIILQSSEIDKIKSILLVLSENEKGLTRTGIYETGIASKGTIDRYLKRMHNIGLIQEKTLIGKQRIKRFIISASGNFLLKNGAIVTPSLIKTRIEFTDAFWSETARILGEEKTVELQNNLRKLSDNPVTSIEIENFITNFLLTYTNTLTIDTDYAGQFLSDGRFSFIATVQRSWGNVVKELIERKLVANEKEALSFILYFGWNTLNNALLGIQAGGVTDVTKSISIHGLEITDGKLGLMAREKTEETLRRAMLQ